MFVWTKSPILSLIGVVLLSTVSVSTTCALTPDEPGGGVQFSINSAQDVKAISPWIYGSNFSSVPNATFDRSGGNRMTGYNWENNASNAGSDWYHHSDFLLASGPNEPPGSAVRGMIADAAANNRAALITVPMAGYVAADGNGTVDETEIAPSPRWKKIVPKKSTIYPGATLSTNPDKTDGYVFTDEFVHWAESYKDPDQPLWYSLDNEPGLWGEELPDGWQSGSQPMPWLNPPAPAVAPSPGGRTHPLIHPESPTFTEMRHKTIEHASVIKDLNPNALVFGGVGYGWNEFTTLQGAPDSVTNPSHPGGDENGEMHYHEWLLQQVRSEEIAQGRKLMDVLDLHWYPEAQGDGVRILDDNISDAVVEARVQAPRSLWDPTYAEESWISQWSTWVGSPGNNGPIKLLPRVQRDIDDFNPDTKIAVSEYNYGAGDHISGAIAQADVLGIFGREGVFAASVWGQGTYINAAFDMYLDYNGAGGEFGAVSIAADTSDISQTAVHASVDPNDPNRMVVVAINRTATPVTTGIAVTHDRVFDHAEVYQLTGASSNPQAIGPIELDLLNALEYTMPAYSISTLVLVSDGLAGDFNRDGTVDAADYTVWRGSLGQIGNTVADANEDNVVDLDDYDLWRDHYGATVSSGAGVTVPEPSALAFLGLAFLGLASLVVMARRRSVDSPPV